MAVLDLDHLDIYREDTAFLLRRQSVQAEFFYAVSSKSHTKSPKSDKGELMLMP